MRIIMCALLAMCSLTAMADSVPTDQRPAVHLEASASREVTEDTAHAVLFVEKTHASATTAQQQVSRVVSAALKEAKGVKSVSVKTGRTSTYAVYDKNNRITSWRVRGELVLESRDTAALSQCVTTLTETMSIGGMGFSLSPEAQRKVQAELQGEAVTAFKEKARTVADQFGYATYSLDEASVATGRQGGMPVGAMLRMKSAAAEAVPMEAGKTTVSVTVSGKIRLEK